MQFTEIVGLKQRRRNICTRELQEISNIRVQFIALVIGLLDFAPKHLWKILNDIAIKAEIGQLQKTDLLATAKILQKILEI